MAIEDYVFELQLFNGKKKVKKIQKFMYVSVFPNK